MLADELFQAHLTALHHVQGLFPDRRGARIGDGARHSINQAKRRWRCRQRLALLGQVATVEQALDDSRAGRLGANTSGVLELLFQLGIIHQLGHVLHGLDQVAFGEGFGRLGPEVLEHDISHRIHLPLLQHRQALRGRIRRINGSPTAGRKRFRQGAFPARFDNLLAHRSQRLAGAIKVSLRTVVFVGRQKLRQVTSANQRVDGTRLACQPLQRACRRGRDDAVVRAYLGVIPGARFAPRIQMRLERGQCRVSPCQRCKNRGRLAVLAQRQIAAIAARVGDQLVGFVK